MRIRIIQGGQTGVDRGAWRGAVECGLERGGWMPSDGCDELRMIPVDVGSDLRPALNRGGPKSRTIANVIDADAVLIVVPDATKGCVTPGTRLTHRQALIHRKRRLVVDGTAHHERRLRDWVADLVEWWPTNCDSAIRSLRLMVAGPRASLWPDGEEAARRIVQAIADVARG